MTLLRRVLGETLRGRRLRQRRTLREVSSAARVSLGYLSEVERGQKEASSELLASICDALDVKLSDLLREVSETMRRSERAAEVARMPGRVILPAPARRPVPAGVGARPDLADLDAEFGEQFGPELGPELPELDADGFDDHPFAGRSTDSPAGATDSPAGATDSPAGATDSLAEPAAEPAASTVPVGPGDLDGVDLAELEAGDELGDLEMILARTELAGGFDGPHRAWCLAGAAA